jgi:hypothetical protein
MYNPLYSRPYAHLIKVFEDILGEISKDLHIRTALAEDVMMLDVRDEQKDTFNLKDPDTIIRTHAWIMQLTPMNYSIFHKDELLLMLTIMPLMSGSAEISFLVDKNFVNASKLVKMQMIKAFNKGLYELPFRRIEAKVKDTFEVGRTFVEKLGMSQEGVLRKFGPENDYILYSLIK